MKSFLRRSNILEGDLCLAVSGGADSVAMLLLLNKLKDDLKINISVRHFEHGIRGEESVEDAEFVRELCKSLGISFILGEGDVPGYAKSHGLSLEEAARKLRYDFLLQTEAAQIATAHTADDNAETVLFNMIRGSGMKGMCGIDELTYIGGKRVVRPLLGIYREQIEQYLHEIGQEYREDSTNKDDIYSRNKIRNQILPLLREINGKASQNINNATEILKQNYIIVQENVDRVLQDVSSQGELDISKIKKYNYNLINEVIKTWISINLPGVKDIGKSHIQAVYGLLDARVGKEINIPKAIIKRGYNKISIKPAKGTEEKYAKKLDEIEIIKDKIKSTSTFYQAGKYDIEMRLIDIKNFKKISYEMYTKCFDYDKINTVFSVRNPKQGDYIIFDSNGRKKPFNRYCIDNKIPKEDRQSMVVIADGSHIIWILGMRMSEYYKVSQDTSRVLEISVKER